MFRSRIFLLAGAAFLSACGGDTLTGSTATTATATCTGTSCPTATANGVSVITSASQVPSDGTGPATITAVVYDKNNNTVANAPVTLKASSGLLAVGSTTTNASGTITASLSAGGDPSNRSITVTAISGPATSTVNVDVTGTTVSLTGPQSLVEPGSGTYTVILKDSSHAGILGKSVTLNSKNNNTLSAASVTTDDNGEATFTVTGANGGPDTLTATWLDPTSKQAIPVTATQAITVSTQSFAITAPAATSSPLPVKLGATQPVTVLWTNGGAPVAAQTVNFSATRGTLSAATAVTDATGKASVTISSTTSGPAVITANGTDVSAQVQIDFLATTASAIDVQASPSTININAQSTIIAIVRDAADNLVEGKTVTFALADVTGGTLSSGTAITNNQGVAQVIYTASSTTSATNGVDITATVQGTGVDGTAELTVAGEAVFLSLGTGNTIDVLNEAQYAVTYAVLAVDSAGNAVPNIAVDLKLTSVSYYKGYWATSVPATTPLWSQTYTAVGACPSEDLNDNGILDPGEDFNGNGKLDPGNVASASPGSVVTSTAAAAVGTTSPAGSATFQVVYPKDHAEWVMVKLTATATVSGTEASTSTEFVLPIASSDVSSATLPPPGEFSPYGQASSCADPN